MKTNSPNAAEWFETPTADIHKAIRFHNQVPSQFVAAGGQVNHIEDRDRSRPGYFACFRDLEGNLVELAGLE